MSLSTHPRLQDGDAPPTDTPAEEAGGRPKRRVAPRVVTVLAFLFVLVALIAPNQISRLSPGAFVRVPLEGLLAVLVVLVLPARFRRVVVAVGGAVLGLLAVLKVVDMGFFRVLGRPFDPVLDWTSVAGGVDFLDHSIGRTGTIVAVVAIVAVALTVLVLMTLSALRLSRVVVRHHTAAIRTTAVLGVVWLTCAALGVQFVPDVPVAAQNYDRLLQVRASLLDGKRFAAESAVDAFRDTPGDQLLTGLRGKKVLFAFVESYGRDAVEHPRYAPQVGALLDSGTRALRTAGFSAKSGYLTSPTTGGGSWLAHSTLLSGLWVNNQNRYNTLVGSNRLTLSSAFRKAKWPTVGIMPGVTGPWPPRTFYGYQRIYDARNLGYQGTRYAWATMPDQYTLAAFERAERARPDQTPVMAEAELISSHAPWTSVPRLVDWDDIGDGSRFDSRAKPGDLPDSVWDDSSRARTGYRRSIEYTLSTLISYVQKYGDDDTVVVFLGDHQPPVITGENASRDVPITIVARDPDVLDRISSWGWTDGLKPAPKAPVWRMSSFRDRFLTAYGPQPKASRPPAR